jgi:hypothetical protein
VLKAGSLASLDLAADTAGQSPLPDTVQMTQDAFQLFYAHGYDQWGNHRGQQDCVWTTDGTLHRPTTQVVSRVWIDATQLQDTEAGNLTATAVATSISTSNHVQIVGPKPRLIAAATQDTNGNGYLDAILVEFSDVVGLAGIDTNSNGVLSAAELGTVFGISYATPSGRADFPVVAVSGANSGTWVDSVVVLTVQELRNGLPQTSWGPYISIRNFSTVVWVPEGQVRCTDQAAPVVWQVYKYIDSSMDPTTHVVKVIMSEPVTREAGSLALNMPPESLFVVWVGNPDGTFSQAPSDGPSGLLAGIPDLKAVHDTLVAGQTLTVIDFTMKNGNELLSHHYLSIRTDPRLVILDRLWNAPGANNQKVRVVPVGHVPFRPVVFPNPSLPDANSPSPVFSAAYSPGARLYVAGGGGGFVTTFSVTVPDSSCSQIIRAYRSIYDASGNLVQHAEEPDLLQTVRAALGSDVVAGGKIVEIDFYWNGFGSSATAVQAGFYTEELRLDYECTSEQDVQASVALMVGSPDSVVCPFHIEVRELASGELIVWITNLQAANGSRTIVTADGPREIAPLVDSVGIWLGESAPLGTVDRSGALAVHGLAAAIAAGDSILIDTVPPSLLPPKGTTCYLHAAIVWNDGTTSALDTSGCRIPYGGSNNPPDSSDCGCGSGTGVALIPPLWLKLASVARRAKRKKRRSATVTGAQTLP